MENKSERFVTIYKQGALKHTKIILDRETGVQYLYHTIGNSGGLTPLIDGEGKPIVAKDLEGYSK